MNKCLIVPYFGPFNNYFPLWVKTCGNNDDIDWLLFTDQDISFTLPKNIHYYKMTFEEIHNIFSLKLNEDIWLKHPYKLCDYRPYYGYLFEEYLHEYDFWGYCDCDVVFGRISWFLKDELFEKYDKILRRGHLSFVRNTKEINYNFLNFDTYKMVIKSPVNYGYDESIKGYHLGFTGELLEKKFSFFDSEIDIADIDFRLFPFHIVNHIYEESVFTLENDKLFQVFKDKSKKEMMYLHLQKRKMSMIADLQKDILIYPNVIQNYDKAITESDNFWEAVNITKESYYNVHKEKIGSWKRDIMRFYYEPNKIECIKYRLNKK